MYIHIHIHIYTYIHTYTYIYTTHSTTYMRDMMCDIDEVKSQKQTCQWARLWHKSLRVSVTHSNSR